MKAKFKTVTIEGKSYEFPENFTPGQIDDSIAQSALIAARQCDAIALEMSFVWPIDHESIAKLREEAREFRGKAERHGYAFV